MPLQPHELDSETEITYWRDRVASLEALVGELLEKNQGLRSLLTACERPDRLVGLESARETKRR